MLPQMAHSEQGWLRCNRLKQTEYQKDLPVSWDLSLLTRDGLRNKLIPSLEKTSSSSSPLGFIFLRATSKMYL